MGFTALFFVRLQRGVLFPCLQLGLFPCLLPDGSSLQRPCRQSSVPTVPCLQQLRYSAPACSVFPMVHPFRQIACLAGACCRARFPLSSTAPPASSISATAAPLADSISATAASLPAVLCADGSLPATASPQRPCQQQTSSGREKYSGLASNLAHLGRMRLSPGLGSSCKMANDALSGARRSAAYF